MIRSKNSWNWGAYGKHPVGKDYFRAGPENPFLQAFSDWIENGFRKLNPEKNANPSICSWRFWARGYKKGSIACGVVRDSSDSIGRPYPLLIMGTGPLKGWEDNWDLLPDMCVGAWSQMEYLSAKRFSDFEQLESEVRLMKSPESKWPKIKAKDREAEYPSLQNRLSLADRDVEEMVARLSHDKALFIPLDSGSSSDPHSFAGLWHSLMRSQLSEAPSTVFMGGSSEGTFLAIFLRALAPVDFVRLWSGGTVPEAGDDGLGAVGGHRLEI